MAFPETAALGVLVEALSPVGFIKISRNDLGSLGFSKRQAEIPEWN
jgi:hypothetical protein